MKELYIVGFIKNVVEKVCSFFFI